LKLLDRFLIITKIPNFMKILPVEARLFYAGGRTDIKADMTKLIVGFRNFGNTPKNVKMFQIRKLALPTTPFPNHYSLIIRACEATHPVPQTVSYILFLFLLLYRAS
jgi:hypothetical protein